MTGFLLGGAAGILCGGALAAYSQRHALTAGIGMLAATLLVALAACGLLPPAGTAALLVGAGFLSGLTFPSRDLLVRGACSRGNTGAVYGFVYSGLDAGSALAPLLFGWLLDRGHGAWVFGGVAVTWCVSLSMIYLVRGQRT